MTRISLFIIHHLYYYISRFGINTVRVHGGNWPLLENREKWRTHLVFLILGEM
jgi:hypothetical protein